MQKIREDEFNSVGLLSLTYSGSMAWAFGAGFWGVAAVMVIGLFVFVAFVEDGVTESINAKRRIRKAMLAQSELPLPIPLTEKTTPAIDGSVSSSPPVQKISQKSTDILAILDGNITKAATLADDETTVLALFKFRKERERLLAHPFDGDLDSEVEVISSQHLNTLIDDYCEGRALAEPEACKRADRALGTAVNRLTARLKELSAAQNERRIGELEKTGNYIRTRHPIAGDDPFSSDP